MADNNVNNNIKTTVEFDTNQAQQEIVKLNSLASDSTQDLQKRLDAKNKAIELQNKLNEKSIKDLERLVKDLTGVEGKEKDLIKAQEKLNKAKLNEVKVNEKNSKSQSKLSEAYADSKSNIKNLDKATGGFIEKLTMLAANPIVLVITALVGVFTALRAAVNRSEKATEAFAKIGAAVSGVINGLVAALEPLVEILGTALVAAIEKPGEAWNSLVDTFKRGFDFINKQVIDRFVGNWKIASGNFEKGVLKMRIAWNEFTGDSEEADSLKEELDKVNEKIVEGTMQIVEANKAIVDLYDSAKEAVTGYIDTAVKKYDEAKKATEDIANAERQLVKNRIALEKQQLTSLKLAEQQRQIRDDISRSIEERIEANRKLGKILDEQTKKELALAQQNLDLAKARQNAEGKTIETIEAIGDAELKILEIQERITGQRSEQLVNEQSLIKEGTDLKLEQEQKLADFKKQLQIEDKNNLYAQIDEERKLRLKELEELKLNEEAKAQLKLDVEAKYKAQKDEIDKAEAEKKKEKERLDQEQLLIQEELDLQRKREKDELTLQEELAFLEKKRLQEVEQEGLRQSQIDTINKRYALEKERIKEAEVKAEKAKDKAIFDSAVMMAGEAFGVAQELALARMIMNAPEAISNVWTQAAKKPTIPQVIAHGVIGSATVIAPIVKGVKDIKKARMSGRASSSGASGGGNISIGAAGGGGGIPTATTTQISDLTARNEARSSSDVRLSGRATRNASANVQAGKSPNIVFSESRYRDFQDQVSFKEQKSTI